jgi:carboxyl-terminal processing protease
MSGPGPFCHSRRVRRGAALTLVFATVLLTGAATGSLPAAGARGAEPDQAGRTDTGTGSRTDLPEDSREDMRGEAVEAATRAMADGKSPLEVEQAAERAVSRGGGRWDAVYSHDEYEEFEDALDGRYTGVGLWARRERDGRVEVTRVASGSPAASGGIRAGDRLLSIDGYTVDGLPVTEVISLLRGDALADGDAPAHDDGRAPGDQAAGGPASGDGASSGPASGDRVTGDRASAAGTTVRLGLRRGSHRWTETLRRARLSIGSVAVRELTGGITVIKVTAFTRGSGRQVRAAVAEAPPGRGVVLDLRGNSGGLVIEATGAASAFLDGGLVATYDVRGKQRALHAERGGDTDRPLVALVDGGTMSAAELLTGALQDRGRAVVVGTRTFGKGSVQMPSRLPGGSVAELTVGHYRTPSGHSVDGRGITPDLEAADGALSRARTVLSGMGSMGSPS